VPVAPYSHHAAKPQPAADRKRRGQPHHAADDPDTQLVGLNLPQEHPSGLNDVFVNPQALPPALSRCQRQTVRSSKEKAATMA
jgi:hypothetical protein